MKIIATIAAMAALLAIALPAFSRDATQPEPFGWPGLTVGMTLGEAKAVIDQEGYPLLSGSPQTNTYTYAYIDPETSTQRELTLGARFVTADNLAVFVGEYSSFNSVDAAKAEFAAVSGREEGKYGKGIIQNLDGDTAVDFCVSKNVFIRVFAKEIYTSIAIYGAPGGIPECKDTPETPRQSAAFFVTPPPVPMTQAATDQSAAAASTSKTVAAAPPTEQQARPTSSSSAGMDSAYDDPLNRQCAAASRKACNALSDQCKSGKDTACASLNNQCMAANGIACNALGNAWISGGKDDRAVGYHALHLYKLGCDQNIAEACSNAGVELYNGVNVDQDLDLALTYEEKGCALKDKVSCSNLAVVEKALADDNARRAADSAAHNLTPEQQAHKEYCRVRESEGMSTDNCN